MARAKREGRVLYGRETERKRESKMATRERRVISG